MKRLEAVTAAVALTAIAAWELHPTCGTGLQIAEANVFWSDRHVLLLVNEVRITQATTNFGAVRQNVETWFGGLLHPTQTDRALHIFFGDTSGLKSVELDLAAPGFWILHGNIYTWPPPASVFIRPKPELLRWDWATNSFLPAPAARGA